MEELFDKLEPLTKLDLQFLYGLLYVCPRNDFEKLIPKVLPFYSITFLIKEELDYSILMITPAQVSL